MDEQYAGGRVTVLTDEELDEQIKLCCERLGLTISVGTGIRKKEAEETK